MVVDRRLGPLDEHGRLRIVGRRRTSSCVADYNIYPAQIKALALRHPGIAQAAAFPSRMLGSASACRSHG
jgi:acyl-CoA synthetase